VGQGPPRAQALQEPRVPRAARLHLEESQECPLAGETPVMERLEAHEVVRFEVPPVVLLEPPECP
jgi:hypothetical protein